MMHAVCLYVYSLSMYALETFSMTIATFYHILHSFPLSTYGENISLGAGNLAILLLYYKYTKQKLALLYSAFPLVLLPLFRFPSLLIALQSLNIPLNIAAKFPQILANYRNGGVGELSAITFLANFFGSLSRIFTTATELSNDRIIQTGFIISCLLNITIVAQVMYYRYYKPHNNNNNNQRSNNTPHIVTYNHHHATHQHHTLPAASTKLVAFDLDNTLTRCDVHGTHHLYSECLAVLQTLRASGMRVVMATNNYQDTATTAVKEVGIEPYVDELIALDDGTCKLTHMHRLMHQYGLKPQEIVLFDDVQTIVDELNTHGFRAVLVSRETGVTLQQIQQHVLNSTHIHHHTHSSAPPTTTHNPSSDQSSIKVAAFDLDDTLIHEGFHEVGHPAILCDHTIAVLKKLHAAGIKCVLATHNDDALDIVKQLKLDQYFDAVLAFEDDRMKVSHVQQILQRYQLQKHELVLFDDVQQNVDAVNAFGVRAVLVDHVTGITVENIMDNIEAAAASNSVKQLEQHHRAL